MKWDRHRKRFVAAVILFVMWVALLGGLAVRSAKRPVARPHTAAQSQ